MRIIVLIISLFLLTGCVGQKNDGNIPNGNKGNIISESYDKYEEDEKAKNIVNQLLNTNGIEKAVVVVNKNTALIGLKLKNTSEDNKQYFKDVAINKTREIDPNISNIEITLDELMYNRISRLNNDIKKGKPLEGIKEDFDNIFKRNFAK
jgi:YhcN/YlaJ family sporulation lipoprotein